jgi:filamentous hemagglutinin
MAVKSAGGFICIALLSVDASGGTPPKLPIPCLAGNCGTSAQTFVQYGAAGAVANGSTMTVTQTTSKAVLNWANFNIANGSTVDFVQPNATAAALNKIWSVDPSIIAGHLKANGQVYLYNQNGIVFDKGAQINVAGLVASTLALPDTLFENGILSANAAGQAPPASFCGTANCAAGTPSNGTPGAISVNPGATLTAADGGRIMLLGSAVTNQGTIATPDGQAILGAATQKVYLAASSDPSMRGLLIAVDGGGTTGTVTNSGQITAPRGNITLAGLIVNQQGMVSATTSVGENGSIYLVAGDASGASAIYSSNPRQNGQPTAFGGLLPNNGGTLILAPGSVTEVLPDTNDSSTLTVPQQASFIPSQIDLAGRAVAMAGNAAIKAPGASVNVYAAGDPYGLVINPTTPLSDNGTIYLDKASVIDVSGLAQVPVPVTQNLLQVTLETNDLQNDPLLRNGFLHGAKVTVNVASPPTLFNIQPYADNIGAGIDQVLAKAGAIQLNATGDVIARAGSTLNVSGGSIAYQSGYGPSTTNLLGADGRIYNISNAPSTIQYVGIANAYSYTDPTWGTTTKGAAQTYYQGYTQGANAGAIAVSSPAVYLRGTLLANTVNGFYQRSPTSLAAGGTFDLGCSACTTESNIANFGLDGGVTFAENFQDALNGNIVFNGTVISATDIPSVSLVSPTQLTRNGFNMFGIFSNGPVTLPAGNTVALAANGGLAVKSGQSIDIAGNITGPGAAISLQTVNTTDELMHDITLDAGAIIDVSGRWINDSPSVTLLPGTSPTAISGGTVNLSAAGDVSLGANTLIDVSGGGWINQNNRLTDGHAGAISLAANFSLQPQNPAANPFTGTVVFGSGATMRGGSLSASGGGSLSVQSGSVTVGSASANTPGELLLAPSFFTQGGFARYTILGQNDLIIGDPKDTADATPITIAPLQQTLEFTQNSLLKPTGSTLASFTHLQTLPAALRSSASVTFATNASDNGGADIGDVTLSGDASIITDPGATVSLASEGYNGSVRVFGSIEAPGGIINLLLETQASGIQFGQDPGFLSNQQILLGPNAVLAAPAYPKIDTLDQRGFLEGSVLAGGSVNLVANKGFIVTDPGSLINVSGASATIDIVGLNGVTPTAVAGTGGTVNIDAREGMVLQGSLIGLPATLSGAAVSGAGAGTLNVYLGVGYDYGQFSLGNATSTAQYPGTPRTLTLVGQTNGQPALPFTNQLQSGSAFVDVATLMSGGFDNVSVQSSDAIAFAGTVSLHAGADLTLDAPLFVGAQGRQSSQTNLGAPYVAVGNYLNVADYFAATATSPNAAGVLNPTSGPGVFNVNAQLIDIRGISGWSGFSAENFSSSGDIRFVAGQSLILNPPSVNVTNNTGFEGAFNTSAGLTLQGAQLYPTTATGFSINDLPTAAAGGAPAPTTVTILAPASTIATATPLSAGGSLSVFATEINQQGVLRAPLGQIALNGVPILDSTGNVSTPGSVALASGSVTSVSADGLVLPLGATANGTQWTYSPEPGVIDVLAAPPEKQISLNGAAVSIASGAKVDLSGGGDLYAYEFIAGQGGSVDVLNPNNLPNHSGAGVVPAGTPIYTYAILPSLNSLYAPIDPQYSQGSPVAAGQTITLSGVPGLAAGTYALLPARYALLPGAYAIEVVQPDSAIVAGSSVAQPNGAYLVAGRFGIANTPVLDSLTSTLVVAPDSTVRNQSQFTDAYGNVFFSNLAAANTAAASKNGGNQSAGAAIAVPQLPADAGQLLLRASSSLSLNGTLNLTAGSFLTTGSNGKSVTQQGQGGDVAITAQNLEVVDAVTGQIPNLPGTVQLDVGQLDHLDAETLILGASSSATTTGQMLTLGTTQTVELKNTIALSAPQVILAAQDSVIVDSGARLTASNSNGGSSPPAGTLVLPGGGALLRVSSGAASALTVDTAASPQNSAGTVTIGAGSTVQAAGGSLLLYGTNTTTLAADAKISAPAVSLYSSAVSLGDAPAGTAGLVLTPQLLSTLQGLKDLTLGSTSTINLYGPLQLGTPTSNTPSLSSITLDAGGIGGYGAGNKVLQAGDITLTNSGAGPATFAVVPDGQGVLQLIASANAQPTSGQITLGSGSKTVAGFSAVSLQADGDILGQGTGSLSVAASSPVPVNLAAAAILGTSGSVQSITTAGAVSISPSAASAKLTLPTAGLGAEIAIEGSSIDQNGRIDLPAGSVVLTATHGDITLGKGSVTAAPGAEQSFTVIDAAVAGGTIDLAANSGGVSIASGATVDVSGISSPSGAVSGGAGVLSVSAPLGTFTFAGNALKGSAAAGQDQGSFNLDVGTGLAGAGFTALDTALASDGFTGAINVRTRSDAAVTISNTIHAGSFVLTADQGSIDVASTGIINTSGGTALDTNGGDIQLWAGNGLSLQSGAQLLANAGTPGPMGANGASLLPHGGNITLGTASGQIAILGGTQQATLISMQGGGGADTDGTLTLRAPRTADDANVAVTVQPGLDVVSRNPVIVEGFRTYAANDLGSNPDAGCGTGGACSVAVQGGMLYSDASTFMASMLTLPANLAALSNVQIRPGIEIDSPVTAVSNGDLTLDDSANSWDLASWNAALGAPVNVTLRAAGNLILEASLSDGFTSNGRAPSAWLFGEPAGAAAGSASYWLTAGADLASANPLALIVQPPPASSLGVPPNSGNLILTPGNGLSGNLIRTGSGAIDIAAGGDVLVGYGFNGYDAGGNLLVTEADPLSAAIYTAGVPSALTAAQSSMFTVTNLARLPGGGTPAYPTGGGNITVTAGDDIRSALSSQLVTDWLWRRSSTSGTFTPDSNTSWWIMFNHFQQGIAALGGGDVRLTAGRDIVNTSAVIPTTGRLLYLEPAVNPEPPVLSDLLLTGGGNLHVRAGGDIISGVFENDWGNAAITAGGSLRSSSDSTFGQAFPNAQGTGALPVPGTQIYPMLVVGNGAFSVEAAGGIALAGVANSTALPITLANQQAVSRIAGGASFFTYAPDDNPSTLNIASSGGNVTLNVDALNNIPIVALSNNGLNYAISGLPTYFLATYPSTLNVAALSGNVNLGDSTLAQTNPNGVDIALFPAAKGNLNLLAAGAINNDGTQFYIAMSEANPTLVPNALAPAGVPEFAGVAGVPLPLIPLHQADGQPISLVANTGDIASSNLTFPKAANMIAGGNLADINYVGKNLNPSDVTLIEAGAVINYSTPTVPVTDTLSVNSNGIDVAGPGHVEVLAGGSINLGDGNGAITSGNLEDSRLPSTGASLVIGAGFGTNADGSIRAPASGSFIKTYLAPNASGAPGAYASTLIDYMQQLYPAAAAPTYAAAFDAFKALTPAQQLPLLTEVLNDELSATGLAHSEQGASYTRGYDAINTLFPVKDASTGSALSYSGDLNMFFSQLKTEQGGDINLLMPGGSVVVGVPNPPANLSDIKGFSTASGLRVPGTVNLGILVLGPGAVEGFADQNFDVNQSRILTLEGGDIILWASNGNIDAGKGAKSASGAPPPVIQTDANGNLFVDPSNAVAGSGIGQLLTVPGIKAGLVNLIAPKGAVNAGDAGIRVAGNLNIAAAQVIGAGNITVVGTSTGVPVSEAGALAGALAGANSLGDSSKSAVSQLAQDLGSSANYQQLTDNLAPSFVVVKMFCMGVECEQH